MPEEIIETPQETEEDNEVMLDEGLAVQEVEEVEEVEQVKEEPIDVDSIKIEIRERDNEEKIDYGEDIDEDDIKTIGSIVEKQTAGVKAQLRDAKDKAEIDSFIQSKPEFSKYRPIIEKYMKESPDVYGRIPVKNIAAMVASDELMKIGAKMEREAQIKADSTKTGGNQVRRPQGGAKDWTKAPKADFEAQKRAVLEQH